MTDKRKPPRYILVIVILLMLPLVAFPWILSTTEAEYKTLVAMYPVYVFATGVLSYQCYVSRRELFYILLVLLIMSHVAIWLLPHVM